MSLRREKKRCTTALEGIRVLYSKSKLLYSLFRKLLKSKLERVSLEKVSIKRVSLKKVSIMFTQEFFLRFS